MSNVVWSDPQFEPIVQQVCTRTGLFFRDSQRETVEMGICQAMRRAQHTSLAEYAAHIRQDAGGFDALMIELTVGETYFFRETGQLEYIRQSILPEILRRRGPGHSIRVWSAGCASGEEAYSLAMLFADEGLGDRIHLLGTDISRRSLERAQKAEYREWSLRGDGASLARKYLRKAGDRYHVDPSIKTRVQFEYLNLALDVYPSSVTGTRDLDLILCRNVLIYFDQETIALVARRFYDALTPGGWIVTASGDPSLEQHAPFETELTRFGLFYRRSPAAEPSPAAISSMTATRTIESASKAGAHDAPRTEGRFVPAPVRPSAGAGPGPGNATLATALRALEADEYRLAAEVAAQLSDTADAAAVFVQSLANSDLPKAEQFCGDAGRRHPLSAHLQYLHAVLLLHLNREQEAAQAARRAVYLDSALAIAHFTLGSILRRLGDIEGARRSFRNARDLCMARPPGEVVRFSDGEHAGTLARASQLQLEGLNR